MMLPLSDILNKYKIKLSGVIHVGAHWAEEHQDYLKCGIERFVYIEPCKDAFEVLSQEVNNENALLFNVACGNENKDAVMYVSHQNQGQSNSFLAPSKHLEQHPDIIFDDAEAVKMVRLDDLPIKKESYDLLVMDTEGFDSEVVKGGTETLKSIKIVYSEVNRGETRVGNMLIDDFDKLMMEHGFKRIETYWPSPNWTWGDAIYLRHE